MTTMRSWCLAVAFVLGFPALGADVKVSNLPTTNQLTKADVMVVVTEPGTANAVTRAPTLETLLKLPFGSNGLTVGRIPYAPTTNSLADSPWYRISTNALGFNGTNWFVRSDGAGVVGVGEGVLSSLNGATAATAFGNGALNRLTSGNNNTAGGRNALYWTSTGSENTAGGHNALYNNTIGTFNTGFGYASIFSSVNNHLNSGFGSWTLYNLTSGSNNVAAGYYALASLTSGKNNTGIGGKESGSNGTFTGDDNTFAGANLTIPASSSFSQNTLLGANQTALNGATNVVALGYGVPVRASNVAQVGTNGVNALYLNGTVGWFRGSGSPEGVITAGVGSFFTREDGGAGTSYYVKESGTGNTGWKAVATTSTVTGGANPTASAGLTAINGSALTFMRSDGAPAISQSISPTWTGTHTFNNNNVTVNKGLEIKGEGMAGGWPLSVTATNSSTALYLYKPDSAFFSAETIDSTGRSINTTGHFKILSSPVQLGVFTNGYAGLSGGGLSLPVRSIGGNVTILINHVFNVVNANGTTVTLPAANSVPNGWITIIKSKSGVTTTVARTGSDTIDEAAANDSLGSLVVGRYMSDNVSNWIKW